MYLPKSMPHFTITAAPELRNLIRRLQDAPLIVFDTEFISEGRYFAQLCLIQLSVGNFTAIIDPLSVGQLDALWELFCDGKREIIVHACRSEMDFCFRSIGKMPSKLFDVQLAAGFLSEDYPAGLSSILDRFLHIQLPKGETRSLWNKRPLSTQQIDYALDDVRYLERFTVHLKTMLLDAGRLDWYYEEMENVKARLQDSFETPRWRNLPKSSGLRPRELAIQREVWFWREGIARSRDIPVNRILRDDLIVELARHKTSTPKQITAIRGFQRNDLDRVLRDIATAVERALQLPESELPPMSPHLSYPQYSVITQFLFASLCWICKQKQIAQQLVGTSADVRELVASRINSLPKETAPRLSSGWRAEFLGSFLDDLLDGRVSIYLDKDNPCEPLRFSGDKSCG